jgi:hypothetical protein
MLPVAVPIFFHLYFSSLLICGIFYPHIIERIDMKTVYLMQVPVLLSLGVVCTVAIGFVCQAARMKIGK